MASGDAQRAWFPEMMSSLKETWNYEMTWDECVKLCHKMTLQRQKIWKDRDIKPTKNWCKNCQEYHESRPPDISIRSMLFTLKKCDLIDDDDFKKLDKSWKKYRKEFNLDACGKNS